MLVVGAGGFAKQLLEIFDQLNQLDQVVLFDNYSHPEKDLLYGLKILHSFEEAKEHFKKDRRFVLGISSPYNRKKLAGIFSDLGGHLESIISPLANLSRMNAKIGKGVTLLTNVIVESGAEIGEGCLVNIGAYITHDTKIGAYTEISPAVKISGECVVGSFCFLGTGAVLLPKVKIGEGAVIAAGAVVTRDVPSNVMVAGVPALIKKHLK